MLHLYLVPFLPLPLPLPPILSLFLLLHFPSSSLFFIIGDSDLSELTNYKP
jgi:hypothetical protein